MKDTGLGKGILLVMLLITALASCSLPTPESPREADPVTCAISEPPVVLGLDSFYTKFCSVDGIPLIAASVVPDAALGQAWNTIYSMLVGVSRMTVRQMVLNKTRVGIIGVNQVTTDMPEYKNLDTLFPLPDGVSWNARARGLGATPFIPLSSGAEENILCYPTDPYKGENILLHEFAHTVLIMGVQFADTTFRGRLTDTYHAALANGLWKNTYAAVSVDEYWAEGVQDYYNANLESIPANGIHNQINTRAELKDYDAALYDLIAEVFGSRDFTPLCP